LAGGESFELSVRLFLGRRLAVAADLGHFLQRGDVLTRGAVEAKTSASGQEQSLAAPSLNHLVCAQQHRLRDCEAELLSRLQINHQLERGGLLDGEIGEFCAL
jgi:hypothetical protein